MTRLAPSVFALLLFVGCSRSGHHPEPIAPVQPKSPYDVRATTLLIAKISDIRFGAGFVWPNQKSLKVADSLATSIFVDIDNTGQNSVPPRSIFFEVTINDKVAWRSKSGDHSNSTGPRESFMMYREFSWMKRFQLNKPGRYEVRLRVWLSERLGETNLDDNMIVQYVEVLEE